MIENNPGSASAPANGLPDDPGSGADGGTDADCEAPAAVEVPGGPLLVTEGEGVGVAVPQPAATRATSAIATTCLKRAAGPGRRRAW